MNTVSTAISASTVQRPGGWVRARRYCVETLRRWFDTSAAPEVTERSDRRIDWLRAAPFIAMHLACLFAFRVGVSAIAVTVAVALYAIRMFALTGFYHRYFSHRTFRTSRKTQFVFAVIGASCVQRGPLWWAAHHRNHHRNADTELDPHSPTLQGFFWSHMGWFLTRGAFRTDWARIPDLSRFPELRWLDRYDVLVPVALAVILYGTGVALHAFLPQLGTNGWQLLIWGFFISTVVLFHATVTINSLAHRWGSRRFDTPDDSRNNAWLALITFGEGWHNNHHFSPGSARQGIRWWELDLTFYGLCVLRMLGLVSHLKRVPARALARTHE